MRQKFLARIAVGVALGMGLIASPAHAAGEGITTTFSGYGTMAGSVTDSDTAGYKTFGNQAKPVYDRLDVGMDSRVGLQGTVKYGSDFSVTTQILAKTRDDKAFALGVEWMYGQYTPIPGLDLRIGRVVMPTFLTSDTRNVGYASTWLRAPNEVYQGMGFTSLDGIQGLWRVNAGQVTVSTQLSHGRASNTIYGPTTGGVKVDVKEGSVLAVTLETGDWTARVAETHLTIPISIPVAPGFSFDYTLKDKFLSTAVQYDNGTAIVMAEWTRRKENDIPGAGKPAAQGTGWYVAGGWRFGKLTPMLRYGGIKDGGSRTPAPDTRSVGLVLRYDVIRNVALKVQVDRYDASNNQAFYTAATTPGSKVHVASFGADFVF